jgi:prepilin peptidase CpaA
VPAFITGLVLNFAAYGWLGLKTALLGAGLGFTLLVSFAVIRALGMGDLKLVVALGAILGPRPLVAVLFVTVLLNGLIAVAMIIRQRRVGQTVRNMGHMIGAVLSLHLPGSDLTIDNPELVKVPFGVAFEAAVILYIAGQIWKIL